MACRGVFYAVTDDEAKKLLGTIGNDDALSAMANSLYTSERKQGGFLLPCDKSWDAMHRCLSNGLLNDIGCGQTLLSLFVLGSVNLYEGSDYIICYVTPDKVRELTVKTKELTKAWFRDRYFSLDPRQYGCPINEDDFDYTWSYFEGVRALYERAAEAGRAIVFLTDQ